jgi:hypothetical protein
MADFSLDGSIHGSFGCCLFFHSRALAIRCSKNSNLTATEIEKLSWSSD